MVIITLTTWTIKSLKKRSYITMVTIKWRELLSFSSFYFFFPRLGKAFKKGTYML